MSKYKSKPVLVEKPATTIAAKFSDLTNLQHAIDSLPEEERKKIGDIKIEKEAITIQTAQVGEVRFYVAEADDSHVKLCTQGTPVPLEMEVLLEPAGDAATNVTTAIEIEIPMMLRPMVGPYIQKAVDQFGDLITKIAQ